VVIFHTVYSDVTRPIFRLTFQPLEALTAQRHPGFPDETMNAMKVIFAIILLLSQWVPVTSYAATSQPFQSKAVEARLITVNDGVPTGAKTLSAGLKVVLAKGWKTYWRTPGEVGLPPTIDWSGSENVANVAFLWPAPHRFHAFGIENFGYKKSVVFPLSIELKTAGQPVRLRARVNMLTCSLVCVPQDFALSLDLGTGSGLDQTSATLIANWAQKVPTDGKASGVTFETVGLEQSANPAIVLTLRGEQPFTDPDIFPEVSRYTTFGPPDIRLGDGGRLLWARIPLTNLEDGATDLALTVTDGNRAASLAATPIGNVLAKPPYEAKQVSPGLIKLLRMVVIAFIGGLILNVMPCVLPVLSIKLASALKASDQGLTRIRTGFLMSAAGVIAFMWVLAAVTLLLRYLGLSVGWGVQFQNPVFLAAMVALLVLFAANLFGLFEFSLPSAWTSRLAAASGKPTLFGDFSTGAFAAVLATPCSAPFLGTAIAFALAGRAVDVAVIFTALGAGLALPYVLVALRPGLVTALPRPGRWMLAIKALLGLLLAATAGWLLWVLNGVAGRDTAFAVGLTLLIAVGALALSLPQRRGVRGLRSLVVAALVAGSVLIPVVVTPEGRRVNFAKADAVIQWVAFDRAGIAKRVSQGQVVFLDITADWCITCKANKALVINRGDVARILGSDRIVAMQADWTRPNDQIAQFLKDNSRYGIPFNAVYGPLAPDGVLLPELLTSGLVLDALRKAGWDGNFGVADTN